MQRSALTCEEARHRLEAYVDGGDAAPELAAHLAVCEACLAACVEASLRRPPEVRAPSGFAARTLAEARRRRLDQPPARLFPYALAAAGVLFVVVGLQSVAGGMAAGWLREASLLAASILGRPELLLAVLGIEAAAALLWIWRVSRA
jgi:hypothetical protein